MKTRIVAGSLALLAGFVLNTALVGLAKSSAKADTPVKKPAGDLAKAEKYRLPDTVEVSEYELSFEPDLSKFTFNGEESVKVRVTKGTREIVLNSLELKITSAQLLAEGSKRTIELSPKFDIETQKVTLGAKEQVATGDYLLKCKFEGTLNNQMRGFYRAQYEDESHKKHYVAATQMEPSDARRMFPCFDEPAFKAVFHIKAIIDKNMVALSNSPVEKEEKVSANKKAVVFEASPKMSTYLLALAVGDFKCTGEVMAGKVPIRVWAVAGKEHLGKYALSESTKVLDYLTDYFGVPYLGKKMDLIGLPEFSAGAMENIGAVTFHESALLMDDKLGSSFQKQSIFGTIAHEFAHQWFGDLVTMNWWDDLWLNEAFATWMSPKVENAIHPEWRSMTETVYGRNGAQSTDSLKSTRAIHAKVLNAAQAIEMFDGITYSKGASILRMLESFVGEDKFQQGITEYLKQHQFANASAEDFWTAIAKQSSDLPVSEIMRRFVFQPGYPQLNVKVLPERQEERGGYADRSKPAGSRRSQVGGSQVELTQYRQLRLGQDKKDPSIWFVPVVMRRLDGSAPSEKSTDIGKLLKQRQQNFDISPSDKALLVNAGGKGYYKVCYQAKELKALQDSFLQLSAEEKIMLLSDCSSLVLPGDLAVEDYYNFVRKIKDESDPMVLSSLVNLLAGPWTYVRDDERKKVEYAKWLRYSLKPLREKLDGWNQKPDESQQSKELRISVLHMLGTMGQDKGTIGEAFVRFNKYAKDRNAVNPDLVATMFDIVTFNGGKKEYDQFIQLWKTAKNPADEERALGSLSEFHQAELAKRTLALGMSKDVKSEDGLELVSGVASNRYTRDIGWPFVKQHWAEIFKKFPEETLSMLVYAGSSFDTPDKEKECKEWYGSHAIPFAKSSVNRMLEGMHTRVLYRQRYAERLAKWVMAEAARVPKGN